MKKTVLAAIGIALFIPTSVLAQIACGPAAAGNQSVGDTVRFDVIIDRIGEGTNAQLFPACSGGEGFNTVFDAGSCGRFPCDLIAYEIGANVPNVACWMNYEGNLGNDWRCHIVTQIVRAVPPSDEIIKQQVKAEAQGQANRSFFYSDAMQMLAVGAYQDPWTASVLQTGSIVLRRYGEWQQRIANDPDDPTACTWDVEFPDLDWLRNRSGSDSQTVAFQNNLVDHAVAIEGYSQFVYDSANRKCRDQARVGLRWLGDHVHALSWFVYLIRDQVIAHGTNVPADLTDALLQANGDLYWYSQLLESQ